MKKLMVFDIQRYALHDGPGIRTTIFLKGCPLSCQWCHNPESQKLRPQLGFLQKDCIGCRQCEAVCPNGVHSFADGIHQIDFKACAWCGKCASQCIPRAIRIYGQERTAEELAELACRDRTFYESSGGGLTISGGEPMVQFPALMELLQEAKKRGLHICLDTCGYAPQENYEAAAQYTDLFLFDYKLTDPEKHKRYTGVSNALILSNLDFLCSMGKDVYLRCPIIPGINDDAEHLSAIAGLSRRYERIRQVNVMAYHDMAKGKAKQFGVEYPLAGLKTVEKEEKKKLEERLRQLGCTKLFNS